MNTASFRTNSSNWYQYLINCSVRGTNYSFVSNIEIILNSSKSVIRRYKMLSVVRKTNVIPRLYMKEASNHINVFKKFSFSQVQYFCNKEEPIKKSR